MPKNESGNPARRAAEAAEQQEAHRHVEAFCLMKYRSDDRQVEEVVWNSRDGVTPFMLTMRDGNYGAHVDWRHDEYAPHHKPRVGDRIFVDLTEERAHQLAIQQAQRIWNGPVAADLSYDPQGIYGDLPSLQNHLLEGLLIEVGRGAPDIVEVTDEMARQYGWTTGE